MDAEKLARIGEDLRDREAADELSQEFSLRFVRGDLKGADRERGRFRDYLKGVLFHLIGDYWRRRKRAPQALPTRDRRQDRVMRTR